MLISNIHIFSQMSIGRKLTKQTKLQLRSVASSRSGSNPVYQSAPNMHQPGKNATWFELDIMSFAYRPESGGWDQCWGSVSSSSSSSVSSSASASGSGNSSASGGRLLGDLKIARAQEGINSEGPRRDQHARAI